MKRFLTIAVMLLGVGQFTSFAQKGGSYKDDIYFSSEDAQKQAEAVAKAQAEARQNDEQNQTDSRSYENNDDAGYDEDYGYASRIRRFSYPDYRIRYYSSFYDPYWYDPYWGPSPGVSVTIGWGNAWPYYGGWGGGWSYGWGPGWGYPYYSPWYYPYGGWGYGYGGGYWAGYNDGYYNGSGYYGNKYRNVTYGPRLSTSRTSSRPTSTLRTSSGANPGRTSGPRQQMQQNNGGLRRVENNGGVRERTPDRAVNAPASGLPDNGVRSRDNSNQQMQQERPTRNRIFGNPGNSRQPSMDRPSRSEQPTYQQSAPSYERSTPSRSYERSSSPSYQRSSPSSSPSRSSGGSSGGSRGGGRR